MDINSKFPDEILSHLFVVGSWLAVYVTPGREAHHYSKKRDLSGEGRRPVELKPFARLAASVCRKWNDIVNWESNRTGLYYSSAVLLLDPGREGLRPPTDIVRCLSRYLNDLRSSNGVDLDILWNCHPMSPYDYSPSAYELEDSLMDVTAVKLFMHGMCMTLPYMRQVRMLHGWTDHPPVLDLLYSMLDVCGKDMQITLLDIVHAYLAGEPLKPAKIPSFAPAVPLGFGTMKGRNRYLEHLPSLCKLRLEHVSITGNMLLPPNLLHLELRSFSQTNRMQLGDLCMTLLHARWLRTLYIANLHLSWLPLEPGTSRGALPHLEVIELVGGSAEGMAILLSAFLLPTLTTLRIAETNEPWFNGNGTNDRRVSRFNAAGFLRSGFQFTAPRTLTISPSQFTSLPILRNEMFPGIRFDFVETLDLHLMFFDTSKRNLADEIYPVMFQNAISLHVKLEVSRGSENLDHLMSGMSFPALQRLQMDLSGASYLKTAHRLTEAWWKNVFLNSECLSLCGLCELNVMLPTLTDIRSNHPIWYSMQAEHLVFQVCGTWVDGYSSIELFGEASVNNTAGTSKMPFPCLKTVDFEFLPTAAQATTAVTEIKLAVVRLASRRMEHGRKQERIRLLRESLVLWSSEAVEAEFAGAVSHDRTVL